MINPVITNTSWPEWSRVIASPGNPDEYNESSVKRLMKVLGPYRVSVKGVRLQFKANNKCQLMPFASAASRDRYMAYWERYLEMRKRLMQTDISDSPFLIMVEKNKFCEGAEYEKSFVAAPRAVEIVNKSCKAAVLAFRFKSTIANTVKLLMQDHGVSRDEISVIWGGYEALTPGKALSPEQISEILNAVLRGDDVPKSHLLKIRNQLQRQSEGLLDLPAEYCLGNQSKEDRQYEIDKFQVGKSKYCIFSFKSGGVGLSLHHSDDMFEQKVRRREDNNWAIVEDIPSIPVRQRESLIGLTWSAIEWVQGLGRTERLTALSTTDQTTFGFQGTIEEEVMEVLNSKIKCIRHAVGSKQSWEDILDNTERISSWKAEKTRDDFVDVSDLGVGFIDVDEEEEDEEETVAV